MFDISPVQVLIVLVIALLVFGPKRLPEMGRSIGRGIREFKESLTETDPPAEPPPPAPARVQAPAEDPDAELLSGVVVPGDAPPPAPPDSR